MQILSFTLSATTVIAIQYRKSILDNCFDSSCGVGSTANLKCWSPHSLPPYSSDRNPTEETFSKVKLVELCDTCLDTETVVRAVLLQRTA